MRNKNLALKWGDIRLSKHKFFEYQFEKGSFLYPDIFEFVFRFTRKTDHAGIEFTFGIYKLFWMRFVIYDHRHWDFVNNCWKN